MRRLAQALRRLAQARNPSRHRDRGKMDSGFALRTPRNDGKRSNGCPAWLLSSSLRWSQSPFPIPQRHAAVLLQHGRSKLSVGQDGGLHAQVVDIKTYFFLTEWPDRDSPRIIAAKCCGECCTFCCNRAALDL